MAAKSPVKQASQQRRSFADIHVWRICIEWGCLISPTDFKLLTRMYYNLSYPPAELMEGQATPGIIIIHYYFIMPAGVILTAARMKEYIKDRPPLWHRH